MATTTLQHRFVALLVTCAAWLLAKPVRLWPTIRTHVRACCYLWPERHVANRVGRQPPRQLLRRPPALQQMQRSPRPPVVKYETGAQAAHDATSAREDALRDGPKPCGADLLSFPLTATTATITTTATLPTINPGGELPLELLVGRPMLVQAYPTRLQSHGPRQRLPMLARPLVGSHGLTRCRRQLPAPKAPAGAAASSMFMIAPPAEAEAAWRHYDPYTAARSVRFKIHGFEPCDVRRGWAARLDRLARRSGACLAGAYIRPGCVELTLDILVAATAATATAKISGGVESGPRCGGGGGAAQLQKEAAPALPLPRPSRATEALVVTRILNALGLSAGAAAGHSDSEAQATPALAVTADAADDSQVQVQILGLEAAAADSPHVVQLSPRVMLLPAGRQSGESKDCASPESVVCGQRLEEWSSDDEVEGGAAASASATRTLQATVCQPVGHHSGCPALGAPAVFARSHSEVLPAHVTRFCQSAGSACAPTRGSSDGDAAAIGGELYDLEVLLTLPRHAGVVLVELAWHKQPGQVLPLLALQATEAAAASELQSLAAAAALGATQASCAARQQQQQQLLDSFLLDTGVWAQTLPHARVRDGADGAPVMRLPARQRAVLGTNLLRFAAHSGLRETEAWLLRGLAQMEPELAAAEAAIAAAAELPLAPATPKPTEAAAVPRGAAVVATATAAVTLPPAAAAEAATPCIVAAAVDEQPTATCRITVGSRPDCGKDVGLRRRRHPHHECVATDASQPTVSSSAAAAGGWPVWLRALLLVFGLSRTDSAEEEAFRAYVAPWETNQELIIQVVEVVALLVLLFRARADLLTPANLTALLGGLPGATTLLARLLLARPAWDRLVGAVKLPRYVAYMAAKAVAMALNRPLPPGVSSLQLGLGMMLHEGLLLPLACVLPVRTAVALTLLKVLPCAAMMMLSGVAPSRRQAGLRCAAVAAVALPTTILCHTYLRICFYRWRLRSGGDAVAACGAGGAGGHGKLVKAE